MKGISLCSGGLDSSLALLKLLDQGHTVAPMFVDYGQWPRDKEYDAFLNVVSWCTGTYKGQVKEFPVLTVRLGEDDQKVGSVWGRGIALAGLASMWAYTHGNDYDFIALGNHDGDVGPDCKPGNFDNQLNAVLFEGTKGRIGLSLPIRNYNIEKIGKEIGSHGLPFDILYSCYWDPPCGYKSINETYRCPGCRRKALAITAAGHTVPEEVEFPNGNRKGRSYQSEKAAKVGY